MALEDILKPPAIEAPIILLVGPPKVGKSSFALNHFKALKPVIIPSEDLTGVFDMLPESEVPMAFPKLSAPKQGKPFAPLDELKKYLNMLLKEDHDYQLLILDTLSSLEPKLIEGICLEENVRSIKAACGGYGRGYDVLVSYWQEIVELLLRLRSEKGMAILLLCHTETRKVRNSATEEEYLTHGLNMHVQSEALFLKNTDAIMFLRMKTSIRDSEQDKSGKTTKAGKAKVYADRQLITDASAMVGYTVAGNRWNFDSIYTIKPNDQTLQFTDLIPFYMTDEA